MASLASSTLLGASNASCAADEGFLSTSELGRTSRTIGSCSCKLKGARTFSGNEYSWLRSGGSSAWRRSKNSDVFSGFRHLSGVVKAGTV